MAARVTGDTSDDTHLADDSKRRENAAGSSGYAPPVQEGGRMTRDTSVDAHHAGHAFTDTTLALVQEERRIASDGNAYTFCEFLEYYGEECATSKWNTAQDTPPPPPPPQENVQAAAVNTLLTPRTAEEIRTSTRIAGTCKKEMRAFLDATSAAQPRDPHVLAFDIPADVSWKHYIARHPDCQRIVGSGITKAQLMFLPEIHDPNRDGQLRLDYVFENLEGVRCQLHPGNKGKDAKPIFKQL